MKKSKQEKGEDDRVGQWLGGVRTEKLILEQRPEDDGSSHHRGSPSQEEEAGSAKVLR